MLAWLSVPPTPVLPPPLPGRMASLFQVLESVVVLADGGVVVPSAGWPSAAQAPRGATMAASSSAASAGLKPAGFLLLRRPALLLTSPDCPDDAWVRGVACRMAVGVFEG